MVYYRNTIPILYEGPLEAEDDLLEWLIQNRNSGDEEDVIEDVQFKSLEAMVAAVENIAVLFCEYSQLILKTRFTTIRKNYFAEENDKTVFCLFNSARCFLQDHLKLLTNPAELTIAWRNLRSS